MKLIINKNYISYEIGKLSYCKLVLLSKVEMFLVFKNWMVVQMQKMYSFQGNLNLLTRITSV